MLNTLGRPTGLMSEIRDAFLESLDVFLIVTSGSERDFRCSTIPRTIESLKSLPCVASKTLGLIERLLTSNSRAVPIE